METHDYAKKRTHEDEKENHETSIKRQKTELQTFLQIARAMWHKDTTKVRSTLTEDRDFREFFGCGLLIAHKLWKMMEGEFLPAGATIFEFLYTLMFMKVYGKEGTMCSLAGGIHPQTFRKWTWDIIDSIANLESMVVSFYSFSGELLCTPLTMWFSFQIVWNNRFKSDKGNDCLITNDGTDFRVAEHGKRWYSFKFKKSGLRYEVGLCILTGEIVWICGPYECGKWNDISIFRNALMTELGPNERVEADDGYIGEHPRHIKCPKGFANQEQTLFMQQRVRNRQETVNKRFKNWGILKQVYRHAIPKHGDVFRAIVVITQLSITNGEQLFECGYKDPPFGVTGSSSELDQSKDGCEDSDISFDEDSSL